MKRVPANRFLCFFLVALCGLTWDLYSKSAVFKTLDYPGTSSDWEQELLGGWITFRLYTSFNEGALWGIGQGYTWLFAALSVVAIIGVVYWLFVAEAARSLWLTLSLALIMAGTLGNLYDRLGLHGCVDRTTGDRLYAVRDFLLFTFGHPDLASPARYHWPVFNFADVFLVTGACMLVLQSFRSQPDETEASANSAALEKTTAAKPAKEQTSAKPGLLFLGFCRSSHSVRNITKDEVRLRNAGNDPAAFWKFLARTGAFV